MITLHSYVLRELLKTFGLTLVALTALFTMGGGLYNVLRHEGLSGDDLLGFIPMLIPIVVTLTMPVAALFASSMVYGRLAADNELVACRAAGINVHRLFLSAILLSVFVAAFTLFFGDLVIPDFVRRLDQFARANLRDIAMQKLQTMGHVRYEMNDERFLLTARGVKIPTRAALEEHGLPTGEGISYMLIEAPVFLQIDNSDNDSTLVRYASAAHGLCKFDVRCEPELTIYVNDGREFDLRTRSVQLKQQQLGPMPIPLEFKRRASMVDLATLLRWRRRPWEADRLRSDVRGFMEALTTQQLLDDCARRVAAGEPLVFEDDRQQVYRITAAACNHDRKGVMLGQARVEILEADAARPLYYDAPRVLLSPRPTPRGQLVIELRLLRTPEQAVIQHNPGTSDYQRGRPKPNISLTDVLGVPDSVRAQMRNYPESILFDPSVELPIGQHLADQRLGLQKAGAKMRRKLTAVVHFRLGFTSSVLATVFMAAALGVIFRGSRALAAFGLACIPLGSVAILMVMARQLGENEGTEALSPILTWGGLASIAVIDLVILRLGVRR